ncbi:MAG TPA: class B sortase [Clostridiales bacterium]|nr:class B sortase [Clostridiales bacterium]
MSFIKEKFRKLLSHINIANIKKNRYIILQYIFVIGFFVFAFFFINEVFIQPYKSSKALEKVNALYDSQDDALATRYTDINNNFDSSLEAVSGSAITLENDKPELPRDQSGKLLKFKSLLDINKDIKGWITIPESDVDYVVLQSSKDDPEYYLNHNMFYKEDKAGSLFLDIKSSVEDQSKNIVIHGHNMTSTDNMFHRLLEYKNLDYYKERPVFQFDSIYEPGQWIIFSIFITNGSSKKEELFDYTRSNFRNDSDFLNFIYQLRIRSLYNMDTIDVKEDDTIITLSTCSYEVKDYRTVIVARKLRDGESFEFDVDSVIINPEPLYPYTFYYRYGGKAPKLTETFEEALENGEITWYLKNLHN